VLVIIIYLLKLYLFCRFTCFDLSQVILKFTIGLENVLRKNCIIFKYTKTQSNSLQMFTNSYDRKLEQYM